MSLRSAVASRVVDTLAGPGLRDLRRAGAEWRRRLGGRPHQIRYFHQADDPYSHLAAQVLGRLRDGYDVEILPRLVGGAEESPEPAMLEAYARKDAADIAPVYDLSFPRGVGAPDPARVRLAERMLAGTSIDVFLERVVPVGAALWSGEEGALEDLATRFAPCSDAEAVRVREESSRERRRLGHYSGGTFHYGGEWYWGVDRLDHLEERLRGLGVGPKAPGAPMLVVRPGPSAGSGPAVGARPVLEYFPSLRSPYTAISMEEVLDLPRRYDIDLRLRPVLPMVMRGMTIPVYKRLYIMRDSKREADRLGVRFGRMCDPVGEPVERGFSLYPWARECGRDGPYLLSFAKGVFADGIDAGSDEGLRQIVERVGLDWGEAQRRLGNEDWRPELERNREDMFAAGLWGVPSFRILAGDGHPEFATWGQDRICLIERELARRLAGPAA